MASFTTFKLDRDSLAKKLHTRCGVYVRDATKVAVKSLEITGGLALQVPKVALYS
jgi:hypothetical protein